MREAHLRVKAIGTGRTPPQHDIGPSGLQLIASQLDRVEAAGAGGVEREVPGPEPERLGEQPGRQTGDVPVPRMNGPRRLLRQRGEKFAGEIGGFVRRQADIAEDDPGLAAVHIRRLGRLPSAVADIEDQVEERVEFGDEFHWKAQPGDIRLERFEEVAARGIDGVRVRDAGIETSLRREQPAIGGHLAGAVCGGANVVPESPEVGPGTGETAGQPDDGDARRLVHNGLRAKPSSGGPGGCGGRLGSTAGRSRIRNLGSARSRCRRPGRCTRCRPWRMNRCPA